MFKNVASQKIQLFAFNATTNLPKAGDAANITAYVSKDHGAVTVLGDTSATEMDAANSTGMYLFDLTQGESNGDELTFSGKSSTANIVIVPRTLSTNPANFTALSISAAGLVDLLQTAADKVWGSAARTLSAFAFSVTVGTNNDKTGYGISAASIQAQWDALTSALTTVGSIGKWILDKLTGDIFARLGLPAGASISADIAAAKVDTAAVKVQTDKLTFTVANQIDSNVLDWKSAAAPAMTGDAFAVVNDATFGNAKLVRSTTPGNTLDVAATGEAGLDFNNIKDAAGAHTLTNITIPTVTTTANLTTNNDKTGYGIDAASVVAFWAYVVEGTWTAVMYMRIFASALAAKCSGMGTGTGTFRDMNDTKNRIVVTQDADGNRSAFATKDGT